jgi:UDP-N-acetylmuramyl pentapeptide phosphotransferase/UDP-N-acetylglucosamine-1-phosphate transferase
LLWLQRGNFASLAVDIPNHRSLHTRPVPRTGGLAILTGVLVAWLFMQISMGWVLISVTLFLMVISFLDDLRSLPATWRFFTHFLAIGVFVWFCDVGMSVLAVAVFSMVWMINLYNFMDGSDGLAGGMTLFGFGFYVLAAWMAGDMALSLAALTVAAAALAFLVFNFHPAKIFMGDAGSIPLGFLAAALGFLGWQRGDWPLWFPILVFSPFIVDATVTLLKRLLRGEKVWHAHREHYYQRLVRAGWGHRKTALWEYGLMISVGFSALWMKSEAWPVQAAGLIFWALLYFSLALMVERRCKQEC